MQTKGGCRTKVLSCHLLSNTSMVWTYNSYFELLSIIKMAIGQLHHIARQLFKALPSPLLEARVKVVRFEVATQLAQNYIYIISLKMINQSQYQHSAFLIWYSEMTSILWWKNEHSVSGIPRRLWIFTKVIIVIYCLIRHKMNILIYGLCIFSKNSQFEFIGIVRLNIFEVGVLYY